ncbi:tRNA pseudouridine(38-40) synthase TruA [Alistipes sp. ZOR0009]|jgi:tRNA pseudouridine38-40 synthase|uniref:tRNA pseudouridine(38-40) synthase TruA n=1 Tax=Alistipes sp. ZOR0009 TaxID=1339253 RepID=UPI0006465F43|nr:tRNA pseudouridine(38-40) synthase TruA [Alistipes sp. ZOR0009]
MARFKLTLEYDGSAYHGWQLLKGHSSIQGKIMDACREAFQTDKFELYGSGRTDAGVHALGQVAHLDVNTKLSPMQIRFKLNDNLPASIAIIDVEEVDAKFHARYDATARSYVYHIAKRKTAFGKKYAYWVKDYLNMEDMHHAAQQMVGLKDFRSFGDKDSETTSTKVEVKSVNVYKEGDSIVIHVVGSHFLWKMVRRMVGVLIEVGRGNITERKLQSFFDSYSNEPAKYTAPPSGLYLEHVYYNNEEIDYRPVSLLYIK